MSQNYAEKVEAAMYVLRYGYSKDATDMEAAEKHLAASLEYYRQLVALTKNTYDFANSMQTSQRKIPVTGGVDGHPANYHWSQLLPIYEKELRDFRQKVRRAQPGSTPRAAAPRRGSPDRRSIRSRPSRAPPTRGGR